MKLQFWTIGKDHDKNISAGIEDFTRRISRYHPVSWNVIPLLKNTAMMSESDLKLKEGKMILDFLKKDDFLVVLDEKGKQFKSEEIAAFLQERMLERNKNIIFLIGGAYGVSKDVLERADMVWSLSKLVFPHQLVRLILAEQIYRACTILKNEKYHHE